MFTKARLKLTFFYLLIVVVIIGIFSLLLYYFTAQHISDTFDDQSFSQSAKTALLDGEVDQVRNSLLIGDSIVILLAGLLSYWLAGKTLKPIKIALDAQEQFSANASHELRTPLSVIKTDFEVFLKNKQPTISEAKETIASGLEEVDRLSGMIENLLVLARSKKSKLDVEFREVDISGIVNSAVRKSQRFAKSKKLALSLVVEDSLPVMGNEKLLEQLFFNLIQNAITYTNNGKISVVVEADAKVVVTIQDTGIGIDKEEFGNIFEPFYKVDSSRSAKSGGVGLGLSIVKDIVDKHKGSITVDSGINRGTTMTVSLPASSKKSS